MAFCDGRSGAAFGVCLGSLFEGVRSVVLRTFFAGVEVLAARLVDIGSFTGACFFGGGVDFGVLAGARLAGAFFAGLLFLAALFLVAGLVKPLDFFPTALLADADFSVWWSSSWQRASCWPTSSWLAQP
ncbi:MAG: hypothetical protein IPN62_00015 [Flavobacteriales bacterium]|nr:hypothetical protein [Flavobacteriales bacterium]